MRVSLVVAMIVMSVCGLVAWWWRTSNIGRVLGASRVERVTINGLRLGMPLTEALKLPDAHLLKGGGGIVLESPVAPNAKRMASRVEAGLNEKGDAISSIRGFQLESPNGSVILRRGDRLLYEDLEATLGPPTDWWPSHHIHFGGAQDGAVDSVALDYPELGVTVALEACIPFNVADPKHRNPQFLKGRWFIAAGLDARKKHPDNTKANE